MSHNSYCVIMAGGIGNRFWPVSSRLYPKQFSDILNLGKSFIRQTYERALELFQNDHIFIITGKEYEDITRIQIPELPVENILKEPFGRNTATCIAYASYKIRSINSDAKIVVIPSDHIITNDLAYIRDLSAGIGFIEENGGLLTIGITPSRAETEYGYIQVKKQSIEKQISEVKTFTEKPSLELAQTFINSGDFLWNAGIFIYKVKDIITEFKKYMYDLHALFDTETRINTPEEQNAIDYIYGQCAHIPIDVGILEHSTNVYVLKGTFGWTDVGTWHTFHALSEKDQNGNVSTSTNVIFQESTNCIVNVPTEKQTIVFGVDDLIIAEKNNYLMICHRKNEDKIKRLEKLFEKK